jgi:hypothetical protein
MLKTNSHLLVAFGAVMLLGSAGPALAGPPLICHPFETGAAQKLSWGQGTGWNTPDTKYDLQRLTADTLRLLTSDAPVLARMENMRRATIYAMKDPAVAQQLLAAVMGRALTPSGGRESIAWFDAGYLIESYRQAVTLRASSGDRAAWAATDETMRTDGYGFVKKALTLAPNADMEFAASLMTQGATASAHRARATASATRGSLLAVNLSRY